MAVTAKLSGGGVEIKGLSESIRALSKLEPRYRKEAESVFKDAAKDILRLAKAAGIPAGYRGPRPKWGRSGTTVRLSPSSSSGAPAFAAEFGEVVADVHGHRVGQYRFKRRTAPSFKPPTSADMLKNRGGYIVQPIIRRRLPHWEKEAGEHISEVIDRAMRSAGVPRGR